MKPRPEHTHGVSCANEAEFRAVLARVSAEGLVTSSQAIKDGEEGTLIITSTGAASFSAKARVRASVLPGGRTMLAVLDWHPGPFAPTGGEVERTAGVDMSVEKEKSATSSASVGSGNSSTPHKPRLTEEELRARNALRPYDVIGNFQILKHLGSGGMAEVYIARALLGEGVDKLVALKTVLPEYGPDTRFGSMFLREARVCATLRHQNLVQVFAFGEAAGRAYLSMEYIHGRDLTAVFKGMKARKQLLGPDLAVAIALELCRALEYVHTRKDLDGQPLNLVHRDVSPGNVILSEHNEVKLMDFGVAAATGADATRGLLVGKVPYMTLDQARGGDPKPQWDLFAVGVMLYQMLTLSRPYKNVALAQLPASREGTFPPPSHLNPKVPAALDALVMRACTEATAFSSATDMRIELERVQAVVGTSQVGVWLKSMFADELAKEQQEIEELTLEGRRRAGFKDPIAASPLMRRLHAVRRRVASTRTWMKLSQRPWLLRGIAAGVGLLLLAGGAAVAYSSSKESRLLEHLNKADAQAVAGRLVGPTGTEMLGELLLAKQLKPHDERVNKRLQLLADTLQSLGETALSRQNREEAAAHFEATLKADPTRVVLKTRIEQIQEEILRASRGRIVQQQ